MENQTKQKAVVILSGGMDSTLSSFIAKNSGYDLIAIHFNYGQKTQNKELMAFNNICQKLEVLQKYVIDIPFFKQLGANALTDSKIDIPTNGITKGVVPITYVPFRNGIFLSIASAVAEKEDAKAIFIGVVEEDSSGYPDCTNSFISNMQNAINDGTKKSTNIKIVAPLINLSKTQIVKEAVKLNVPLELTWSCYKEEIEACGVCDSCRLRLNGFEKANLKDPIKYKSHF